MSDPITQAVHDATARIDRATSGLCPCGAPPAEGSAYCSDDCRPTHISHDTDTRDTGHLATPMRWRPDRHCVSAERCRAYDPITKQPAYVGPAYLCDPCLTAATRDVRTLVYDYVDLEQLQIPTLSQAMDTQPRSKAAPPMPLRGEPEALQAEIHYVTTLWADELRREHQLHNRQRAYLVGAWHTTSSNPPPPPRRLAGGEVQEAVDTLVPRLRDLAALSPRTVYPSGVDSDPEDIAGWEAIHHLQHLRQRARSMLGWTRRVTHLPGTCSGCGADELRRDEPRYPEDPCDVYCNQCGTTWTSTEYDQYVTMLVWPARNGVAA